MIHTSLNLVLDRILPIPSDIYDQIIDANVDTFISCVFLETAYGRKLWHSEERKMAIKFKIFLSKINSEHLFIKKANLEGEKVTGSEEREEARRL